MAYRVAWSPRAVEDLEAIAQYIAADSAAYAAAAVKTIPTPHATSHSSPTPAESFLKLQMKAFESGSLTAIESFIALKKIALRSHQ